MKFKKAFAGLVLALSLPMFALDGANVIFKGTTDKPALEYEAGEPIKFIFTLDLQNGAELDEPLTIYWSRSGDDGISESGKIPYDGINEASFTTKLDCDGFIDVYAKILREDGSVLQNPNHREWGGLRPREHFFHGGAAVHPERLESYPEPEDFDEFWAGQKERLAKVPIIAELKEIRKSDVATVYIARILCAGPRPVTGVLCIPLGAAEGKKYPAKVFFDGYGFPTDSFKNPGNKGSADAITFNVNAHGVEYQKSDEYYKAFAASIQENGQSYAFDETVNSNPEVLYFNGMALRVMRAFQYLKTLDAWDGKNLESFGGSQGGLQTIWAAALEPDLSYADSYITWCCDLGGEIHFKRHLGGWRIRPTRALEYYDCTNMAKRIKCRIRISRASLGDYTCPPSGIAVMYNNITSNKSIRWWQNSEHGNWQPNCDTFDYSAPASVK